jgi:hypothetical protein
MRDRFVPTGNSEGSGAILGVVTAIAIYIKLVNGRMRKSRSCRGLGVTIQDKAARRENWREIVNPFRRLNFKARLEVRSNRSIGDSSNHAISGTKKFSMLSASSEFRKRGPSNIFSFNDQKTAFSKCYVTHGFLPYWISEEQSQKLEVSSGATSRKRPLSTINQHPFNHTVSFRCTQN